MWSSLSPSEDISLRDWSHDCGIILYYIIYNIILYYTLHIFVYFLQKTMENIMEKFIAPNLFVEFQGSSMNAI